MRSVDAGRDGRVAGTALGERVSVVVITHNRRPELLRTLGHLARLPDPPPVVVVDNGSHDGTADAVRAAHPAVTLVEAGANLGAVGRNVGVERVRTPYVAFCDDDTWWDPGAMDRAVALLDRHPRLAAVTGRILVEPGAREDDIVAELRDSPVPAPAWLPGPALMSVLAGATVVRTAAFREVGGFHPRLWLGGEEELFATDLVVAGWHLCYAEDVVVHHQASLARDAALRRRLGVRNTLWTTWLRRPLVPALRWSAHVIRSAGADPTALAGVGDALRGLPWVLRERRPVPRRVETAIRSLDGPRRRSRARRYGREPGCAEAPTPS